MRFSFVSVLALASSFVGVMSAPAQSPSDVVARQSEDLNTLIQNLNTTITPNLNSITATTKTITPDSTDAEKAAASSSITNDVNAIVTAVKAATAQVPAAAAGTLSKVKRQSDTALATIVANLIATISGVADDIVGALGLTSALSILNPLTGSLSALLLSLEGVVDNLLLVVKQLLDSILTGLSIGLAGLVL
jgi:hypothetical protein